MKKRIFLLSLFLLPFCAFAQPFVVTTVKPGTGMPAIPPVYVDTIRPGVNFGIRILDAMGGMIPVYLGTVKLNDSSGIWEPDPLGWLYTGQSWPSSFINIAGGFGFYDEAFYRGSYVDPVSGIATTGPYRDCWIKIVASASPAVGGIISGDSSKPLYVLAGPIDSAGHTIVVNPNPMGAAGIAEIAIFAPEVVGPRSYEIKIVDPFGYLVRDLMQEVRYVNDGTGRYMFISWDGTNGKGKKVSNGVYQICVKVIEAQEAGIWKKKIGVVW